MDKEILRKQVYEELQGQFESRLRDARKQKSVLEEEIEVSAEKWRSERRRLNSEIDRLEAALAETRESRRKSSNNKSAREADSQGAAAIKAAAEEKLKKAAEAWEDERGKFQAEIARLQTGLADLIEKSNNPLRSNQAEKDRLDAKLAEAERAKRQAQDALAAATTQWEEEKRKLVAETVKSRRTPPPSKPQDETRLRQLEKQLQEATKARSQAESDLQKEKQAIQKLNSAYAADMEQLAAKLEKAQKESATLRTRLGDFDKEREAAQKLNAANTAEMERLASTVEKAQKESAILKATIAGFEKEKEAARKLSDDHTVEMERLASTLENAQKESVTLRGRIGELEQEHAGLTQRLNDAVESDKTRQAEASQSDNQALTRLQTELDAARHEAMGLANTLEAFKATAKRERDQYEFRIRELTQNREDRPDEARDETQAQEVIALRAELEEAEQELEILSTKLEELEVTQTKERNSLEEQVRELASARKTLEHSLREAQNQETHHRKVASGLEEKLRQTLEELDRLRAELAQRQQSQTGLEKKLAATGENVSREEVDQLRQRYEARLQQIVEEKTRLSADLKKVESLLETERERLGATNGAETSADNAVPVTDAIDAEVARVQEMIAGIARLIDDPETELSTVIRKNVERAELDAYLRGILFSLGRDKGL